MQGKLNSDAGGIMPGFMFNLSSDEKTYLKDLVKWTLLYYFERGLEVHGPF